MLKALRPACNLGKLTLGYYSSATSYIEDYTSNYGLCPHGSFKLSVHPTVSLKPWSNEHGNLTFLRDTITHRYQLL